MKSYMHLIIASFFFFICSFAQAQAVEISTDALAKKENIKEFAPTLIDELCDNSLSYTVVRMREGEDAKEMKGKSAVFTPEIKLFLTEGQPGDAYHFRSLKTECDGEWKDVKSKSVVVKIKE